MKPSLRYAVVTPARNEASNLQRLAESLRAQRLLPSAWIIVDNGSTDGTSEVVRELTECEPWIRSVALPAGGDLVRGGTVTRAFQSGLSALGPGFDLVVKVDADVSFSSDYFADLVAAFRESPDLGIASGVCLERSAGGDWQPRYTTGETAWGAARAYRQECLEAVLPLEGRMGWDGIDSLKAGLHGWRTQTLPGIEFRHHRREGERDGARHRAWAAQGRAMHYMGYRSWYVVARALYRMRREPVAAAMVSGFVGSALKREPQCPDRLVRDHLRSRQTIRSLPRTFREARGVRGDTRDGRQGRTAETADVLLICTSGGHLAQLASLRRAWHGYSVAWVTDDSTAARSLLREERVYYGFGPAARSTVNAARNLRLALRLIGQLEPKLVVSTGAALCVPFVWVARARGAKVFYIESVTRITSPSLTCRLVRPVANRVYVQWPELARRVKNSIYVGSVFSS